MKKTILSLTVVLLCNLLRSQSSSPEVLASGGGFANGPGFTNSYTIGQGSLPETFSTGTFILTQGFQQPADVGTGLAPVNTAFSFAAYPNPTNGQFFLEYSLTENADVLVETFDVLGQCVFSENSSCTSGKQICAVNLSGRADGIYFVRCTIKTASGISSHTSRITLSQ